MVNGNVELYYEEHGKGLPVVLVHGFPLDHTTWEPVVPLLRDHARLILPDLRGFGKSPAPENTPVYTMRSMADDLLSLLDKLGIEKAVLVGHSMGGYISLAFAHAYPHRLAGLGLVATQAAADKPESRQNRMIMADEIKRRGLEHSVEGLAQKYTANPALVEPLHGLILAQNPKVVIAALKGMAERPDSTEFLSSITAPSVVVAGTADKLISMERAETMNQLLAWSWLVEINGAGHMVMMEDPNGTADALHKFFHTIEGNQKNK